MPVAADRAGIPEIEEALGAADFQDRMHEIYAELRGRAPVYWSPSLGYWLVTSYTLIEEVLHNPGGFSSHGATGAYIERLPREVLDSLRVMRHHFRQPGLIHSDGARHTALRRAVNPAFTPGALAPLADDIRRQAARLLEPAQRAGERFDVVAVLAEPLPVLVIADVLGVPSNALDRFPRWSMQLARFFTGPRPDPAVARDLDDALVEWRGFVADLIDQRTSEPRDDFVSLAADAVTDGRMTREDAIAIIVHALQAGHETTTNLIGAAIYLLLRHPDQLALARSSPEMLACAVEEALRCEPVALNARRTAMRDLVLGGQSISAGDTVVVNFAAAHRDPARYSDPERFDITRGAARGGHLGFGRGVHFCLGAPLARLEAPIALDEFFRRFPHASLCDPAPQWKAPRDQRGLKELWIIPDGRP